MYRVLVADDEQLERQVLAATLTQYLGEGCEILEAQNGRQALEMAREKRIHVAVLDVEMPGMNGLEAAAAIKKEDKDCQIIFLTAFDDFHYARSAIQVRALDYLLKPWDKDEVLGVVEEALRLASLENRREDEAELSGVRKKDAGTRDEGARDAGKRDAGARNGEINENSPDKSDMVSGKILRYIQDRYMQEISMHDAAGELGYSDAYFSKLFKQLFDKNFTTYLTEYRMERAKELLDRTDHNIKEIGEAVGYYDSNYFTKVFKRYLGMLPTEYRLQDKIG